MEMHNSFEKQDSIHRDAICFRTLSGYIPSLQNTVPFDSKRVAENNADGHQHEGQETIDLVHRCSTFSQAECIHRKLLDLPALIRNLLLGLISSRASECRG
jgi:hypothetical protein